MNIENIKPDWGLFVHASYDEVMSKPQTFWKELAYANDLIFIRGFGDISEEQFFNFIEMFGSPWPASEYIYSQEDPYLINPIKCISKFSNKIALRLGNSKMPWHSDIPNHGDRSFPWRSLYIKNNPNPKDGLTSWMNIRLDLINPSADELDLYSRIKIENQSWYRTGEEIVLNDFIKTHPITHKKSLRANYFFNYNSPTERPWIKRTFLDGVEKEPYDLLGPIYKRLQQREDLVYTHEWQLYDIVIYDNWNFLHRRTYLNLDKNQERLFFRANIHHEKTC